VLAETLSVANTCTTLSGNIKVTCVFIQDNTL
jgi:hypothetical protein